LSLVAFVEILCEGRIRVGAEVMELSRDLLRPWPGRVLEQWELRIGLSCLVVVSIRLGIALLPRGLSPAGIAGRWGVGTGVVPLGENRPGT
jgi:hypothetical protein